MIILVISIVYLLKGDYRWELSKSFRRFACLLVGRVFLFMAPGYLVELSLVFVRRLLSLSFGKATLQAPGNLTLDGPDMETGHAQTSGLGFRVWV